jgi:hypothetical protein
MDELIYMNHDATERPHIAFGSRKSAGEFINTNYQLGSCPANVTQMGLAGL